MLSALTIISSPRTVFQQFTSTPSLTPDEDVFKHLASIYSFNHGTMHLGLPCKPGAPAFTNGTTNGAAWYPLTGTYEVFLPVCGELVCILCVFLAYCDLGNDFFFQFFDGVLCVVLLLCVSLYLGLCPRVSAARVALFLCVLLDLGSYFCVFCLILV